MTSQKNNFIKQVERAMELHGRSHMRPVIEKEILHYDILFTLDNANLLDKLTFQGGTSLRLCYGAPRFSEDLDFTGGSDFKTKDLIDMKAVIEDYLGKRYELEITVKEPKDLKKEPEYREIKISKWQIKLVTHPERRDFPKQIIKIEVGNVPSYTREPKPIQQNYDFLPDGYNDTLIMVETLDEILSDKLVSFVNCQAHIRHRDIWDLHWLKQQGAKINIDLIRKKIIDYQIQDFLKKINFRLEHLPDIIRGKDFKEQMIRFLPMDVQERTISKEKFNLFLESEIKDLFKNIMSLQM